MVGCASTPPSDSDDPRFFANVNTNVIIADTVNEGLGATVSGRNPRASMESTAVRGGARLIGAWVHGTLEMLER